jgi:ATP-dependent Clp protease ATP-binding subunit ClpC
MPTYRFPVLIWQDYEGQFTASLAEYGQTGIGVTAGAAVAQLKEYLSWFYQEHRWQAGSDFLDAKLITYRVNVRPQYLVDERIYPGDETIALRVACVHGRQEGGLLVCALPVLGIRFYYYDSQTLKDLVVAYVQETLKGLTPRDLTRYLAPREVRLDELVLTVTHKEKKRLYQPEITNLSEVADPLGHKSVRRQFSRAWEREAEVADLVARLTREKANVVLVGAPGSGKSAVIVDAVRQIERQFKSTKSTADEDEDEDAAYEHKFWLTNGARMIAGMQYLGQWEQRCERVIEELSNINGVLCVESLLDLVRSGGQGPSDSIGSFLIPYVQRGELRVVGEATQDELDACRRLLPGLVNLFQVLKLPPLTRDKAISILDRIATAARQNTQVGVSVAVIELVYQLFNRFFPYHAFPGKTVAFLNSLLERSAIERASEVTTERVIRQFIRQTGLPELFLRDDLLLAEGEVSATFSSQVIGQAGACTTAARLVTTFKSGVNDPNRPIGVLLFCGPTGVGKTELAKAISRFFFGHGEDGERIMRLDMSEYSGPDAADRLVGHPTGEPSDLIKKLRQQPFVVLLLDEIEKAAPEVFDVLLSVFDEGRLTDRYGRTTMFRSAVIILTSNLGADKFGGIGFDNQAPSSYEKEAMAFFRPEFVNRIDEIVQFNPLDKENVLAITRKELSEIGQREGLTRARIRLECSDEVVSQLARVGFDARYGARQLQRTIDTLLIGPLGRYIVEHSPLGNTRIRIDVDEEDGIVFSIAASS